MLESSSSTNTAASALVKHLVECLIDRDAAVRKVTAAILQRLMPGVGLECMKASARDLKPASQRTVMPILEEFSDSASAAPAAPAAPSRASSAASTSRKPGVGRAGSVAKARRPATASGPRRSVTEARARPSTARSSLASASNSSAKEAPAEVSVFARLPTDQERVKRQHVLVRSVSLWSLCVLVLTPCSCASSHRCWAPPSLRLSKYFARTSKVYPS